MLQVKKFLPDSKDETPEAKKVNQPAKKSFKKPTLNYEILEEVFIELFDKNYRFVTKNKKGTENIENFMASGVEPFKVALEYFQRIYKVDVYVDFLWIYPVKNEGAKKNNKKYVMKEISNDCVLLKPILNAIRVSITNLTVFVYPYQLEHNTVLPSIYEALIIEGLEEANFYKSLPEKNILPLCSISTIKKFYAPLKINDLQYVKFQIPAFSFKTDFSNFSRKRPQKISMPWIERLAITGDFDLPDISEESMQSFVKCVVEIFPNLRYFNANFKSWKDSEWDEAYEKLKNIQLQWFNGFSTTIEGKIEFFAGVDQVDDFSEVQSRDDEYIVDVGIAVKKFDIHNDLKFEFVLRD